MSGTEVVTLRAAWFSFSAWKTVEVRAAINEACRSFSVQTTEHPGEWAFPPGTPIQLAAGADLLLDGYVNKYSARGSDKAHDVKIAGRSRSQDLVDCAAVHPKGYAKDRTTAEFVSECSDRLGVEIRDELGLARKAMQQLYQGETCYRLAERYLRGHGATVMGNADGSASITNASKAARAAGALVEGVNIKEWSVDFDDQDRHSEYTVKGQARYGTGSDALRIKEQAADDGVARYRPRIIVAETDTDKAGARERAEHEKERAAGNAIRGEVTVQGWRDAAGKLWTPNTLIFVASPTLMHLEQDMLIESVTFEQDDRGGTTAQLGLVDPRSYRGRGHDGKKSDKAWNNGWSRRRK
jgi:prophage tail gpP-like protein